jgi:hypothetical protein
MKKPIILILVFISIFIQKVECRIAPSIDYEYFDKTNDILVSIDLKSSIALGLFGIADELTLLKLSAGERFVNGNGSLIYDFGLLSYQSLIRIPIIKDVPYYDDSYGGYHELPPDYSTFLTFSYQGLSIKNTGIYNKDYNWSSAGMDIQYKKFKQNTHFYTKLSFMVSANTLENNSNYFSDIDSAYKKEFCFSTKVSSLSKLMFKDFTTLRLEAYYRRFYNHLNQKEIGVNAGYEFNWLDFIVNPQIGFTSIGSNNNWKGFCFINLGLTYVIVINNTIY